MPQLLKASGFAVPKMHCLMAGPTARELSTHRLKLLSHRSPLKLWPHLPWWYKDNTALRNTAEDPSLYRDAEHSGLNHRLGISLSCPDLCTLPFIHTCSCCPLANTHGLIYLRQKKYSIISHWHQVHKKGLQIGGHFLKNFKKNLSKRITKWKFVMNCRNVPWKCLWMKASRTERSADRIQKTEEKASNWVYKASYVRKCNWE